MVMDDLLVSFDCLVNSVLPLSLNERVSFYAPLCKKIGTKKCRDEFGGAQSKKIKGSSKGIEQTYAS